MKPNRRQLLWSGLGAAIVAAIGRNHLQRQADQAEQTALESLATEQFDSKTLLEDAYQADLKSVQDLVKIQRSVGLPSPPLPYNRDWSKLLIRANKLATQQYLTGTYQTDYDGSITVLPLYADGFADFQQTASFQAPQRVQERFSVDVPITDLLRDNAQVQDHLDRTKDAFERQVKQAVELVQSIPVYYGYLLTSAQGHLLVFRGTQRADEFFEDILAFPTDYLHPQTQAVLGQVHLGFNGFYQANFAQPVIAAVKALDPSKPLFITGHSLGGALAHLAALDVALQLPKLKPNLQLYTYASPRVGDPAWVALLNQEVTNHYRVVNLADIVPMMPLSKLFGDYVHAGEQWSFLAQQGDFTPNHIVETYRQAIEKELERTTGQGFDNFQLSV